jgi:hypothetical protein
VNPIARDRLLAMARHRCRPRWIAEWSKDHVVAIGSLNLKPWLVRLWLNWRPGGGLRWKVETDGRGVVRGKPAPPRL